MRISRELLDLAAAGIIRLPERPWCVEEILALPAPDIPLEKFLAALDADREEGWAGMLARLNPSQPIAGLNGATVGDFWAWAYSDVLSNLNRSMFAEFLVGSALGETARPRVEWDCVDFRYRDWAVEVKASGYLNWLDKRPSPIRFDIQKKVPWDARTNTYGKAPVRSADCYVFCLHKEKDRERCNVLDVTAWEFYVVATEELNRRFGEQKSLSLGRLRSIASAVGYPELRRCIDGVLGAGVR